MSFGAPAGLRLRHRGREGNLMPRHKVGTREEWSAARKELLEREQELGSVDEELAKQRQELPWVAVEKVYNFDTEDGRKTLAELFDARSQLLIHHLMFGRRIKPPAPAAPVLPTNSTAPSGPLTTRDVRWMAIPPPP